MRIRRPLGQHFLADRLETLAQGHDGWNRRPRRPPAQESRNRLVDQIPGRRCRRRPRRTALHGGLLQIIEFVAKDILQPIHPALDIGGYRNVNHQDRPVPAGLDRPGHGLRRKNALSRTQCGNHDIGPGQPRRQFAQRHVMGPVAPRNGCGAPGRRMGHAQLTQARAAQLFNDQITHLARTDQQALGAAQVAGQLASQTHDHGGNGHGLLGQPRFAAHPLGGGVGGLERLIEAAAHETGTHREAVSLLHLSQDLRLANHLAIE